MLKNNFKIIIYGNKIYREIELSDKTEDIIMIGTNKECQVRFNRDMFFDEFCLYLKRMNGSWNLSCNDTVYMTQDGFMKENSHTLNYGDVLQVKYQTFNKEIFQISFIVNFDQIKQNYERVIDISSKAQVSIGGIKTCDIFLNDKSTGTDQIILSRVEKGYTITEVKTTYGVYVNGYRRNKSNVSDYDFFMLDGYYFYIKENKLYTSRSDKVIVNNLAFDDITDQKSALKYPYFNRNTRVNFEIPEEGIEVYPPENKPTKPKKNIILTLIPALAMLALVIVVRGFMGGGGSFIIYSVCSMSIGIIMSVVTYLDDGRQYRKDVKKREEKYLEYIKETEDNILLLRNKEKNILEKIYTSMEDNIGKVEDFDRQLFEKDKNDKDYLSVRIGSGKITAHCETKYTKQKFKNTEDELVDIPEQLEEKYKFIEDAPIISELGKSNAIGVVGDKDRLYELLKNITLDIVIRHYFKEVKLYYMFSEYDLNKFEWIHWLQNVDNEDLDIKNFMYDEESCNINLEFLYSELVKRQAMLKEKEIVFDTHFVIFIFDSSMIARHPVTKYIQDAKELGFTFLFFEEYREFLPKGCTEIIELDVAENKGILTLSNNGEEYLNFVYPKVMDQVARNLAIKLSSVYIDEVNLESELTKNISLFEMLNLISINDLDIKERWSKSEVYKSMSVPLGVKKKGELVYLDISDKASAHGPHGLVAGTTGSGKSEIIQTYILSLASWFHPYDVGFVIIDFKGGGMANQFKDLPHLIGTITNIDGREINRSLLSIKSELVRRQEAFAAHNVNHINDYIKLVKEGKASCPMPHLIMVVDEFAELKSEYPEFMKEIISAARIGRTLGIHLILATQKPAGVVDNQVWSNSKFKLCLKVQTREDSMEVIKTPLAAEIVEAGRAYFQVGNNEIFELFQSAYSGAKVFEFDGQINEVYEIYQKNLWGKKSLVYTNKTSREEKKSRNQLETMVDYISNYCDDNAINRLPGICLPPLEDIIYLSNIKQKNQENIQDGVSISVGIFDDPELQLQEEVLLNFSENNTYIVGSTQTGKTTLLQTIIYALMDQYTPEQVSMYIVDCGNMALKVFEESNYVGGVALVSEDEKVINLFKLLKNTIEKRKERFVQKGLGTYKAYIEAGYKDLPQILVFIDNIAVFKEFYGFLDDTFLSLSREGQSVGINLVVTSTLTSTIGYKVIPNFGTKIALYCNEKGEYSNLFSRCRMEPKEVPGRGLCLIDKRIVEFQTALPVNETKEYLRVARMKEFIELKNGLYPNSKAIPIPMVPGIITRSELKAQRPDLYEAPYTIPIGIEYNTVSYSTINLLTLGVFAVMGREQSGRTNFVKQILTAIEKDIFKHYTEVYLFDSGEREFDSVKDYNIVKEYNIDHSNAEIIFENIMEELRRRKELALNRPENKSIEDILKELPLQLIIIENAMLVKSINSDKKLMEFINTCFKDLKNMKICIIFSNIENAQVTFNAGELHKMLKENKKAIVFDDAINFKFFELSLKLQKEFAKNIDTGDGYLCMGTEITKIKTILNE